MNRVYYNKSMLLTALLPMLLIVVSTLYLLLDGADKIRDTFLFGVLDSPWLFYPVLLTLFATFAEYSWLSLRKVVRKKPAIRWGSGGVALAKDARVAWAAVENIELVKHKKKTLHLAAHRPPHRLYGHASGRAQGRSQALFQNLWYPCCHRLL